MTFYLGNKVEVKLKLDTWALLKIAAVSGTEFSTFNFFFLDMRAVVVILLVPKLLNVKSFQMMRGKKIFHAVSVCIIYRNNSCQRQNSQLVFFERFFVCINDV